MNADSNSKALVPYYNQHIKTPFFEKIFSFAKLRFDSAFSKRKRVFLLFLLFALFFSAIGFVYFSYCGTSYDSVFGVDFSGCSYLDCVYSLRFVLLALFLVFLSGITVIGRFFPFVIQSFAAFSHGAYLFFSCSTMPRVLADVPVFAAKSVGSCTLLFIVALQCSEAFFYSKRAFYGSRAIFQSKSLLNYFAFFISSCFVFLLIIYTLFFI